jgi:alkaline phosphatase D
LSTISLTAGATTSFSVRVIARITGTSARLAVSDTQDLATPMWFEPVATMPDGTLHFEATGLAPLSQYYYGIEDTGSLDTATVGRFRTHAPVGTPWSHRVATIGDAGLSPDYPGSGSELRADRISNAPTFDTVRAAGADLIAHLGDLAYYDLGSGDGGVVGGGSLTNYRRMYTDIFAQSKQHQLYRDATWAYMWDNHDFGYSPTPGYSDGNVPDKGNAAAVYRERVPHYPTPEASGSPYQSWQMGRVLYILNDTRYNRSGTLDPDTPEKTMLGQAQLEWMFNLLETTTAEALVWLMPTPWLHLGGQNTWGAFSYERATIVDFLTTTAVPASGGSRKWAQSLVQASADIHALGLCSPGHNPFGGFPVLLSAPIDATPNPGNDATYDLGYQAERGQWGTVDVTDDGDQITLTLTGWAGPSAWGSQSLVITTAPPPVPVPPAPPLIAVPTIRSSVRWLGVHQTTGRIIAELPDITGEPDRQLSAYANSQLEIPLASPGPGYVPIEQLLQCTDGRSAALVCVFNDVPLWMGIPTDRVRGSAPTMTVPTCTPEGYWVKRRVKDHSFQAMDRAMVAYQLALDAEQYDGQWQGLGLEYDIRLTGDMIDIDYKATDRTTVYDAIRTLCADGLEFEIAFDWADASMNRVVKIARIGRRIGRVTGTPAAMFDTAAGTALDYRQKDSWQTGKYANIITAMAPGQGDSQPVSAPAIDTFALDGGAPVVEHIIEPGNNITDPAMLTAFANSDLPFLQNGTTVTEVDGILNGYPRLGVDCLLGDMVSHRLSGPGHPKGHELIGEQRMTGWSANPKAGTWKPRLMEDQKLTAELAALAELEVA